jgi:hypothetical protein
MKSVSRRWHVDWTAQLVGTATLDDLDERAVQAKPESRLPKNTPTVLLLEEVMKLAFGDVSRPRSPDSGRADDPCHFVAVGQG